jgi:hypothetical protein
VTPHQYLPVVTPPQEEWAIETQNQLGPVTSGHGLC